MVNSFILIRIPVGQPDLSNHCLSTQILNRAKWFTEPCGTVNLFFCECYTFELSTSTTIIDQHASVDKNNMQAPRDGTEKFVKVE